MLDDDGFADVAAACGADLVVVSGRDRMIGSGFAEAADIRPTVRTVAAPFPIAALATGRFGSAIASPERLAIASSDGHVAVSRLSGEWHQPLGLQKVDLESNYEADRRWAHSPAMVLVVDQPRSISVLATDPARSGGVGWRAARLDRRRAHRRSVASA
jgi:hypothetical protein